MSNRFFNPIASFSDGDGNPLAGGTLTFYTTGTSTKTSTYSDPGLTTPNTNPVVLDGAGRLPNDVFLDPAVTYKVVLADADEIAIWTADPVVDPAANVTAAISVFAGDPNGNVAGNAGSAGGSGASMVWDSVNKLLYVCTTTGTTSTAVWTEVAADIGGAFVTSGVISPASLGSGASNYNPTGLGGASIIRQDASVNLSITGIVGGTAGRRLHFHNISSFIITLTDEGASSSASNRFALGGSNLALAAGEGAALWYDGVSNRWRLG